NTRVRVDTTFVEGPTNSVFDNALELEEGEHTTPLTYNRGFTVLIHSGIEPSRNKTFEEARTEIVSEYQEDLEKALVARLRERYNAVTYPSKVAKAFDNGDTEAVSTNVSGDSPSATN
ncbi:MAG: peptidyl-prolyl cis-trans isomerase, partial [Rhodothermia bacterium]|nr:peptidyl-prolyl cis-trans isomerase [Rhodothermia bacterium]